MRKICLLFLTAIMLVTLSACNSQPADSTEKYIMNGSVSYGTAKNSGIEKTKVTYTMTITGSEEAINNIDSQQPLVNPDYIDLLLENGPHDSKIANENEPYLEISGSFVFDTAGKTKEEINGMDLFKGIEIIDKDQNSYVLTLNSYTGK